MVKNKDVMQDFRDLENTENAEKTRHLFIEDSILYSYGYHYPLCVRLKDNRGYNVFLVNIEGYSVTTAKHIGDLIRTITRLNNLKELIKEKEKGNYNHIILLNNTKKINEIIDYLKYKLNQSISQSRIDDISLMELEHNTQQPIFAGSGR